MLGIAIDVGLKNMSLCALRLPEFSGIMEQSLSQAKQRCSGVICECWESVSLSKNVKESTFVAEVTGVVSFIKERAHLFQDASYVIVEHQMKPKMRCLAASLFATIRCICPELPLYFQQSPAKLAWKDLKQCLPDADIGSYTARKKTAIAAAAFILDLRLPERRPKTGQQTLVPQGKMGHILTTSSKRDDLSDSLLHLFAYDAKSHIQPRRKRKKEE